MTDELTLTTGETAESRLDDSNPPAPVVAQRADIEYVVLIRNEHNGPWNEGKRVKAKSPNDAIEAFIGDGDPGASDYVAIASRYWSPQSYGVEIETTRRLVPQSKAAK